MLVFLAVFFYRVTISGTVALWRRSGATLLTFVYFDNAKALEGFKIDRYLHYGVLLLWCSGGDLRPHSLLDGIYILSSFSSGAQAAIWGHIRATCVCQQTF